MLDLGALQRHIRAMEAGDDAQRRLAIHFLKEVDEQDWAAAAQQVIHSLVKSLKQQLIGGSAQPAIRREILTVLGNIGPRAEPAIPSLIELLHEQNPDAVREAVVTALGRIGRGDGSSVDPLIELLSSCRPALAIQTVRAIGNIGCANERVRTTLTDLWRSSTQSQNVQAEVAIALCKLNIAVPGLVRALTAAVVANQDVAVRKSAATALAWCDRRETDVVPGLLRAAQTDKNDDVRQIAEAGLTKLGLSRKQAVRLCSDQLAESTHAEPALRQSGELAVPALVEVLTHGEPATQEKAARILGSFGELSVPAVPALRKALRSAHLEFRLAAAKSLWMITNDAATVTPVLVGLLGEKWSTDPEAAESRRRFLQTVMEALRRIGPPAEGAVPALLEKSKDKNRMISESALGALKEIAPAVRPK